MSEGGGARGDGRQAARAVDALRRGWPVALLGARGAVEVLAVETATSETLAEFDAASPADILLSAGRAETLKIVNQREAATPEKPVRVRRENWHDLNAVIAMADPAFDLKAPLKGPFRAVPLDEP
ncbi:MAG: GTP cyclohydrolase II, partial [Sphingomonadaceae bacterium]|nr:GTP cyclohydrolase II [Sphingomonadaceae bacterium]